MVRCSRHGRDRSVAAIESRGHRHRAVLALEMSANSGMTLTEVGARGAALRLALAALESVVGCGVTSASRLEAAAMLRDGWRPGRPMFLVRVEDLDLHWNSIASVPWRIN